MTSQPPQQQAPPPTKELGAVGYETYSGGVNMAARNHRELRPNQLAGMINCTVRGGWVTPRDGYRWLPVIFQNNDTAQRFQTGVAQGACFYQRANDCRVIYAVSGELFSFSPVSRKIFSLRSKTVLTPFDPMTPFVYMAERAGSVACQDGTNQPVIITGSSVRITKISKGEMPGGRIMADGWGRLLLTSRDGSKVYFSNHEASPVSGPFDFTEANEYFLNAPFFAIPARCGNIVAAGFVNYVDTASGLGPCIVWGSRGTMTYDVSQPRPTWITGNIARMTLPSIGACSHRCAVNGESSLYFRDQYGRLRNLQNAIASQKSITVRRFDREITPLLAMEDGTLKGWHGGAEFSERALFTAMPLRIAMPRGRDVCHQGVIAWNADVLSSLVDSLPAVWEGLHTGLRPQLITAGQFGGDDTTTGENRLLILSADTDLVRRIYEQVPGLRYDVAPGPGAQAPVRKSIEWSITTRWFDWGHANMRKKITSAILNLGDIRGPLKIEALWRTSDSDGFKPWFVHETGSEDGVRMGKNGCEDCAMTDPAPGTLDRWPMPAMPDAIAGDGSDAGKFSRIQFVFRFTGWCEFRELAFEAVMVDVGNKSRPQPLAKPLARNEQCPLDLLTYNCLTAPPTYGP